MKEFTPGRKEGAPPPCCGFLFRLICWVWRERSSSCADGSFSHESRFDMVRVFAQGCEVVGGNGRGCGWRENGMSRMSRMSFDQTLAGPWRGRSRTRSAFWRIPPATLRQTLSSLTSPIIPWPLAIEVSLKMTVYLPIRP